MRDPRRAIDAVIIGAGPAGLMAAEEIANTGHRVVVTEAKPSVARKLLMAGKSGLNLTKQEPFEQFMSAFGDAEPHLRPMLSEFGPDAVVKWAEQLDQTLFTGSTGRVFPTDMKASPLLRAWLTRLGDAGVEIRTRWRWMNGNEFDTPDGSRTLSTRAVVLACGGASWARLGSTGEWVENFPPSALSPFRPANVGFRVAWSEHMASHMGNPVKNTRLTAGVVQSRGEWVISDQGIEGGGIYEVSAAVRDGAPLTIDLFPEQTVEKIRQRIARRPAKESTVNRLRKGLGLAGTRLALALEFGRPFAGDMAETLKAFPCPHQGPRPMDQAISVAGGLRFDALTDTLMLRDRPGMFAAGEMLDWEAPTGGYLLTASMATGRWAGRHAAKWLKENPA